MTSYSRGVCLAVVGTFFYAFLGLSIKFAGQTTGIWQIMLGRALFGLLLAVVLARLTGIRLSNGQTPGMLLTALANFGAAALVTVALTSIPIFEALVLWYLLPAWTTLLAARFLGDKITLFGAFCIMVSICGAVVVLWPEGGGTTSGLEWGHLAGLCSSFSAASAFVLIRYHRGQHALGHFFHFCVVALVLSGILIAFQSGPAIPPAAALAGIGSAALCGGLGQILIFASVAYIPPTEATLITMGEIIVAAVGAYFLFDEGITPRILIGGLMIIGAGLGINLYNSWKSKPSQDAR